VKSAYFLTGALAPAMVARGGGAVINIGSINASQGMAGSALYSATKATLHSLTRSWAAEYGPGGVRVNTIAPGLVQTEGTSGAHSGVNTPSIRRTLTSGMADTFLFEPSPRTSMPAHRVTRRVTRRRENLVSAGGQAQAAKGDRGAAATR
jgi:NAD(P)-dependent dehydrogenase (short-subunit alcohol dehydrogenase family)